MGLSCRQQAYDLPRRIAARISDCLLSTSHRSAVRSIPCHQEYTFQFSYSRSVFLEVQIYSEFWFSRPPDLDTVACYLRLSGDFTNRSVLLRTRRPNVYPLLAILLCAVFCVPLTPDLLRDFTVVPLVQAIPNVYPFRSASIATGSHFDMFVK